MALCCFSKKKRKNPVESIVPTEPPVKHPDLQSIRDDTVPLNSLSPVEPPSPRPSKVMPTSQTATLSLSVTESDNNSNYIRPAVTLFSSDPSPCGIAKRVLGVAILVLPWLAALVAHVVLAPHPLRLGLYCIGAIAFGAAQSLRQSSKPTHSFLFVLDFSVLVLLAWISGLTLHRVHANTTAEFTDEWYNYFWGEGGREEGGEDTNLLIASALLFVFVWDCTLFVRTGQLRYKTICVGLANGGRRIFKHTGTVALLALVAVCMALNARLYANDIQIYLRHPLLGQRQHPIIIALNATLTNTGVFYTLSTAVRSHRWTTRLLAASVITSVFPICGFALILGDGPEGQDADIALSGVSLAAVIFLAMLWKFVQAMRQTRTDKAHDGQKPPPADPLLESSPWIKYRHVVAMVVHMGIAQVIMHLRLEAWFRVEVKDRYYVSQTETYAWLSVAASVTQLVTLFGFRDKCFRPATLLLSSLAAYAGAVCDLRNVAHHTKTSTHDLWVASLSLSLFDALAVVFLLFPAIHSNSTRGDR